MKYELVGSRDLAGPPNQPPGSRLDTWVNRMKGFHEYKIGMMMNDDDNWEIEPRFMNLSVCLSKQETHD